MESQTQTDQDQQQWTLDGIEKQLRNIINETYCCKYINPIKFKKNNDLYIATLSLYGDLYGGLTLSKQCNSYEEFFNFFKKEIKSKRLDRSRFFKLKIYANFEI